MNSAATPGHLLAWDSNWWGVKIARLDFLPKTNTDVELIKQWLGANDVDMAMALIPTGETVVGDLLMNSGFDAVDQRITLHLSINRQISEIVIPNLVVREATADDAERLGNIAAQIHQDSRFYTDPKFPNNLCDELFRTWIQNDIAGRSDVVFVGEVENELAGYLSVIFDSVNESTAISLVGISPEFQRRGIAKALLARAQNWALNQGAKEMVVATQVQNIGALRLYEANGFSVVKTETWFHWWLN
jgi:dTDP-4-amino-4,6-dideoxy-D-galactose acyltransferase